LLAVALRRDLEVSLRWAIGGAAAVDGGPFLVALAAWLLSLQAFRLPSSSMAPTLVAGDHVLVTGLAPGKPLPEPGDVVVFRHRSDAPSAAREEFIKRVIALPGDRVESRQRQLSVNGKALHRCPVGYLDGEGGRLAVYVEFQKQRAYLVAFDLAREHTDFGPFVVPSGQVFVLGDNRDRSFDSSRWNGHHGQGVPADEVDGVARLVWFPPGRARWLDGTPLAPEGAGRFRAAIEQCLGRR
jgi:signal peptidase I